MRSDSESSSSSEEEETVSQENEQKPSEESDEEETATNKSWHKDDLVNLILAVREQCPPDIIPFDVVDIDWEKVKCGFSGQKCQEKWKRLISAVRHYRTLEEVTMDLLNCVRAPQFSAGNKLMKDRSKTSTEKKEKKKSGIQKINPEYPSMPRNAYSFFTQTALGKRDGEKQRSFSEVSEMWKNMSSEEKKEYEKKAEMSRNFYLSQLEEYSLNHPDDMTIKKIYENFKKSEERRKSVENRKSAKKTPSIKNYMKKPAENHVDLDETELNSSMDPEVSIHESPSKKRKHNDSLSSSTPSKSPKKKKKKEKKWTGERVFIDKKRDEYLEEHPDLEESVLESKLARKYAKLSEAKQAKYERLAEERNQST